MPPSTHTGGNPDSNTLLSEMTTVICLDDFHSLDRSGRSREKVTALDPKAQDFALMKSQVSACVCVCVCAHVCVLCEWKEWVNT